jgi:TonB family protein
VSLRKTAALLAVLTLGIASAAVRVGAQDTQNDFARHAKSKVQPAYPELARKMNITGTVKVEVTVAPNGSVKDAKVTGGHPLLGNAALDAVRKWRFEPAAAESSGTVFFKFENQQ